MLTVACQLEIEGQTERYNRVILLALRAYVTEHIDEFVSICRGDVV